MPSLLRSALVCGLFGALGAACGESAQKNDSAAGGTGPDEGAASWKMPNPPASGLPNPESYDLESPDVVKDEVTGLIWQRRVDDVAQSFDAAASSCNALVLDGHDDWRLPTLIELVSLVDFSAIEPAIDGTAFPATPSDSFWSATPVEGSPDSAWYLGFSKGYTYVGHREQLMIRARCVRRPESPAPATERYTFDPAGIVNDTRTGLSWQREIDATGRTWDEALRFCAALELGGAGWRLPSMKELQTLVDFSAMAPALDLVAFAGTPPNALFWSSSAFTGSTTDAWYVDFGFGAANNLDKSNANLARCTR